MSYAWIENNAVRDICAGNPAELFHPDIAALYSVEVPDGTLQGATLVSGFWTNPVIPEPVATPEPTPAPFVPPSVSPVEFKLLFTAPERVAIKTSTDAIIQDFFEIVSDPRLTHVNLSLQSTQDALGYLAIQGVIAESRIAEILQGEIL